MMTDSAKHAYEARLKRFQDAAALRRPDRVPIASASAYFFYKYAGFTFKDAMYDYQKAAAAIKESMTRLQWDMAPSVALGSGPLMELFGLKQYRWPGHDLPDTYSFQFLEKEYMGADEYDELLANPEGFALRKLIPRISTLFEPLSDLPLLHWLSNGNSLLNAVGALAGRPPFLKIFGTLQKVGSEALRYSAARDAAVEDITASGFPMIADAHCNPPFDWIADYLRGMRGAMLDMYRNPGKLLAAIDLFTPMVIERAIAAAKKSGNPRVFMPLHRGAAGFMSNEQFAKFYWPSLKKILIAMIDAGLTPMPFFEGDYTPRLEYLAELPQGKVLGTFHIVDLGRFKEILGGVMCFRGNVPADLLVTGAPERVRDYVKMLIDTLAGDGGLIIDGGSGIPYESKAENVEAMTEVVFDYGVNR